MTPSPTRAAGWMLVGAFFFAIMGASTHALGPTCDWRVVALVRALVMFASSVTMTLAAGKALRVFKPRTLWVRSFGGSFSLVCNFYAMTALPVSDALTLSSTYPLWILALSTTLLGEFPTLRDVLGVASGLIGVALIQQPHGGGDKFAVGVALLSAMSTAVAMLGLHRLKGIDTSAVVAHFAGVASLVSGIALLFPPDAWSRSILEPRTLALLAAVSISGTIGQLCLTKAYAHGNPTLVSVVGLTQVAYAMGFDILWFGRGFTPLTLLGFAFVLAPTAVLSARAAQRLASTLRRDDDPEPEPPDEPSELGPPA